MGGLTRGHALGPAGSGPPEDLAGGGEGENEMGVFMSLASENSALLVKRFLAAMPAPE